MGKIKSSNNVVNIDAQIVTLRRNGELLKNIGKKVGLTNHAATKRLQRLMLLHEASDIIDLHNKMSKKSLL